MSEKMKSGIESGSTEYPSVMEDAFRQSKGRNLRQIKHSTAKVIKDIRDQFRRLKDEVEVGTQIIEADLIFPSKKTRMYIEGLIGEEILDIGPWPKELTKALSNVGFFFEHDKFDEVNQIHLWHTNAKGEKVDEWFSKSEAAELLVELMKTFEEESVVGGKRTLTEIKDLDTTGLRSFHIRNRAEIDTRTEEMSNLRYENSLSKVSRVYLEELTDTYIESMKHWPEELLAAFEEIGARVEKFVNYENPKDSSNPENKRLFSCKYSKGRLVKHPMSPGEAVDFIRMIARTETET